MTTRPNSSANTSEASEASAGSSTSGQSEADFAVIRAQARRMALLLSVGVGCLVASPIFFVVGRVVDRPLPAHVPPEIVGDWTAEDGRTCCFW